MHILSKFILISIRPSFTAAQAPKVDSPVNRRSRSRRDIWDSFITVENKAQRSVQVCKANCEFYGSCWCCGSVASCALSSWSLPGSAFGAPWSLLPPQLFFCFTVLLTELNFHAKCSIDFKFNFMAIVFLHVKISFNKQNSLRFGSLPLEVFAFCCFCIYGTRLHGSKYLRNQEIFYQEITHWI